MDLLSAGITLTLLVLLALQIKKSYFRTHAFQNKYNYKSSYTGEALRISVGKGDKEYMGGGSISPFGLKVQAYCKFANISCEEDPKADFSKNPKGKVPYLEHKGKLIPDSSFIVDYLKQHSVDLDKELTEEQKAQALLIQRTVEDHLYWSMVYFRWNYRDDYIEAISSVLFKGMPGFMKPIIRSIIRKNTYDGLYGHGLGRHTVEEIKLLTDQDFKCLSVVLGNKDYILGTPRPTSADASLYGLLANILLAPPVVEDNPIQKLMKQYPNLVEYTQRIRAKYFE